MQNQEDVYYTVETPSGRKVLFLVPLRRVCQHVDTRYRLDGNSRKPTTLLKEYGYTVITNIINRISNDSN